MAIENAAERAAMLADFGVTASYTADGGSPKSITVIFDQAFLEADANGNVKVESTNPIALCRTADVSDSDHATTIVIEGTTYKVVGVQADGTGFTLLVLETQ